MKAYTAEAFCRRARAPGWLYIQCYSGRNCLEQLLQSLDRCQYHNETLSRCN